jgi:hypothetical protein
MRSRLSAAPAGLALCAAVRRVIAVCGLDIIGVTARKKMYPAFLYSPTVRDPHTDRKGEALCLSSICL